MRRLCIVAFSQFGYLTDAYYWCKLLKDEYAITYVCWDYGQTRIDEPGVRVVYVPRAGGIVRNLFRFIRTAAPVLRNDSDLAIVVYFKLCTLLRLLVPGLPMVMDVRTGYVMPGKATRLLYNTGILLESAFFHRVTVISEDLRSELRIPKRKAHLLPLGAEPRVVKNKIFDGLRLLYVGTLVNRQIHVTVQGFDLFCREAGAGVEATYDIVGAGRPEDEILLRDARYAAAFPERIRLHGRIPHRDLGPFFERATVGMAYIPDLPYLRAQPSTKVLEYALAGLPVLASDYPFNRAFVVPDLGVVVPDTPEGVRRGLWELYQGLHRFDSERIRQFSAPHAWTAVVNENLRLYIRGIGAPVSGGDA